jgi:hypothetical protein
MAVSSSRSLEQIFARYVRKTDTCWWWTGGTSSAGYGAINVSEPKRRIRATHRVSYEMHIGQIPAGMFVCHRCDNRACVNPAHLFAGTQADNSADMVAKSRQGNSKKGRPGQTNPAAKLTVDQVVAIRNSDEIGTNLAARLNVSKTTISRIRLRKIWRHIS